MPVYKIEVVRVVKKFKETCACWQRSGKELKKEDIFRAMRQVGLDPTNGKRVAKYSQGMRQRLGLAQAIMEQPDLLILDEPMNGLDKQGCVTCGGCCAI